MNARNLDAVSFEVRVGNLPSASANKNNNTNPGSPRAPVSTHLRVRGQNLDQFDQVRVLEVEAGQGKDFVHDTHVLLQISLSLSLSLYISVGRLRSQSYFFFGRGEPAIVIARRTHDSARPAVVSLRGRRPLRRLPSRRRGRALQHGRRRVGSARAARARLQVAFRVRGVRERTVLRVRPRSGPPVLRVRQRALRGLLDSERRHLRRLPPLVVRRLRPR